MDQPNSLAAKQEELDAICKGFHPGISCRVTSSSLSVEDVWRECGFTPVSADNIYVFIRVPDDAKEAPIHELSRKLMALNYVGSVYLEFLRSDLL